MSSLKPGCETNIGLTYRLLLDLPPDAPVCVYYEPGIQWQGVRRAPEVLAGVGINRQIKRAYSFLARNYQPGDRIVLLGYSRGAYAVRSLAGLIDRMGLLRDQHLDAGRLETVYEHYRNAPHSPAAQSLRQSYCHTDVPIHFLGVFDTVRALGIRWPGIWRFMPEVHPYHDHTLGAATTTARQALALNETRAAFAPVLRNTEPEDAATGRVVQMWFKGTHGDIGGHLNGFFAPRPLANVSLNWMLAELRGAGIALPQGWDSRFPADASAPSVGNYRGWQKLFLMRRRRRVGSDPSERLHITAQNTPRGKALSQPADDRDDPVPTV